jgi:hypothetical protein
MSTESKEFTLAHLRAKRTGLPGTRHPDATRLRIAERRLRTGDASLASQILLSDAELCEKEAKLKDDGEAELNRRDGLMDGVYELQYHAGQL